jgi:hypothetical protein
MKTQVTYLIHNQTQQDIHLGYWVSTIPGISSQEYKVIQNNITIPLPKSSSLEWIILSQDFTRLGKFRLIPSLDGSWFWSDYFILNKEKNMVNENHQNTIITIIQN